jgi:peptidoglycan hydrolase-like protein with peptidoglycan-binding domain
LQLLLAYHGFLPADAKIDGSYGAGTRTAIVAAQKEAQLPENGFMSEDTAGYLRNRGETKR